MSACLTQALHRPIIVWQADPTIVWQPHPTIVWHTYLTMVWQAAARAAKKAAKEASEPEAGASTASMFQGISLTLTLTKLTSVALTLFLT